MVRADQRSEEVPRTSVWLEDRTRRGGRGGGHPSGLDRERITEVTVRLLDAEGPSRFSMRRLAAELEVTAMSVYWYVDTKDDLLELALDRTFGELRLPDPATDEDWRDQLRALAREYRVLLVRHPWLSPLAGRFLNIGPNAMEFSRVVQQVIRRTGLPAHGVTGAIAAVFQFVYGYGTIEGHFHARVAATGMTPDAYHRHALHEARQSPDASGVIEESARIMAARGGDTVEEMLERDFAFALDLLVAGIEVMVARGRD
ncbi:TetR/AcrR family transcriptional regulator [Streptomyces sp. CHD11]|uniref:TetR/AcrR family transcriptional regulator n=1 Tax=Streptomyces sp. CHD11 TaxID=2741325 RepID=UPI001BFC86FD|nr:TetR/AcrR family transcriptional regulator [Streptomyces sp. CHD11]MBT3155245.1 TetR/AcrR family transcriptional regulator [Streptomyces sp. CHD11]